jgi:hypothetical protein
VGAKSEPVQLCAEGLGVRVLQATAPASPSALVTPRLRLQHLDQLGPAARSSSPHIPSGSKGPEGQAEGHG